MTLYHSCNNYMTSICSLTHTHTHTHTRNHACAGRCPRCWSSCTRLILCISSESHPITRLLVARKGWNAACSPSVAGRASHVLARLCSTPVGMLCRELWCYVVVRAMLFSGIDAAETARATSGAAGKSRHLTAADSLMLLWRRLWRLVYLNIHEPNARLLDGSSVTSAPMI